MNVETFVIRVSDSSLTDRVSCEPRLSMVQSTRSFLQKPQTFLQVLQIHAQLITTNLISDAFAASRFLDTIVSKTSNVNYAELVFAQIHQPNSFICNTMVKCYTESATPERALRFYAEMRRKGLWGDNYTYPFVLKACGVMCGLLEGRLVQGDATKRGFGSDVFVVNGLISMYCRCGETGWARSVFDGFSEKDLVSWNSMLAGYVGYGEMEKAQTLFDEMPERDVVSWSTMIDGYGKKTGDVNRARAFFDSMPARDLVSWNSMIDGYAKVGEMEAAREIFDKMLQKNVISWSILIDGYVRHGDSKEALSLFRQMLCQGIKPDRVSVVGAVSACSQLGALDQGRWIHLYMNRNRMLLDIVVQTALLDMYLKCGSLDEAFRIFNRMLERNVVTWNVMIVGLGMNGHGEEALQCFAQMEMERIPMDDLIFLGVLMACSHANLSTEGLRIFNRMKGAYRLEPKLEHYGCLVDLLGRAGQLDQAQNIIQSMPMKPNAALWGSLLLACRIHQNVKLAEIVVERLAELKADDSGVYVLMSNIYADARMWDGMLRIRKLMKERKMKKETGRSVIEVDGNVEEFVSGERSHILREEVELAIWSLAKMSILAG